MHAFSSVIIIIAVMIILITQSASSHQLPHLVIPSSACHHSFLQRADARDNCSRGGTAQWLPDGTLIRFSDSTSSYDQLHAFGHHVSAGVSVGEFAI